MPAKKIFFSYSTADRAFLDQCLRALKILIREGRIQPWSDQEILPGEVWRQRIEVELNAADIIIFLVSVDLLATDFVWDIELPLALQRQKTGAALVVPIILRPCDWQNTPLKTFNALPVKGKPLSTYPNRDDGWMDVVNGLRRLLDAAEGKIPEASGTDEPPAVGADSGTTAKTHADGQNIPEFFIYQLKEQIREEYEIIIRYRKLKNDTLDRQRRQVHQDEIDLREENIREIEEQFIRRVHNQQPQIPESKLLAAIREVKHQVETGFRQVEQGQADIKAALDAIKASIDEKEIDRNPAEEQKAEELLQAILSRLEQIDPAQKQEVAGQLNGELSTAGKLKLILPILPGILHYEQELIGIGAKEPVRSWQDLWRAFVKKKPKA